MSDSIPPDVVEAYRICRRIQMKFGQTFTSAQTISFGNSFRRALEIDPTGKEAVHLCKEFEERLTPMKG